MAASIRTAKFFVQFNNIYPVTLMQMPMMHIRQMAMTVNRIIVGMLMTMLTLNRRMIGMKMVFIIMVMAVIMGLFKMSVGMFVIFWQSQPGSQKHDGQGH